MSWHCGSLRYLVGIIHGNWWFGSARNYVYLSMDSCIESMLSMLLADLAGMPDSPSIPGWWERPGKHLSVLRATLLVPSRLAFLQRSASGTILSFGLR